MPPPKKKSAYQRLMIRISCLLPAKLRPVFLHPAGWENFSQRQSIKTFNLLLIFLLI